MPDALVLVQDLITIGCGGFNAVYFAGRWAERGTRASHRVGAAALTLLNAVRYHTTGRAGMSDVEKVVFLADKTEPDELTYHPEFREVRDLAQDGLDAAMLRALELYLEQARREGWMVHPDVVAARKCFREHGA